MTVSAYNNSELTNIYLFAYALVKLALCTGFAPWLVVMGALHIGRSYRITHFSAGIFTGRCIGIITIGGERTIQFLIIDTMRPRPRVRNKCPFPHCVNEQDHRGQHEFPSIREGNYIDVPVSQARFLEVPKGAA
jgi:hypothetical protein